MKKLFLLLVVSIVGVMPMLADNNKMITREELPKEAQMFLTQHFEGIEVLYAKADCDMGVVTSYDVVLEGDVKVEFNRSGEWTSVDCERGEVPNGVLPQGVLEYVGKRFAGAYVVEIEKGLRGYEVKLSNDIDLEFDKDGKFMRVD
jgi:hypothetical protein